MNSQRSRAIEGGAAGAPLNSERSPAIEGGAAGAPLRGAAGREESTKASAGERSGPGGSRLRVRTVEIRQGEVVLIDQLALPQQERFVTCRTWREVADRISDMTVRGAPAIGVTAAGGIALAAAEAAAASPDDPAALRAALEQAAGGLLATRPTAVNLRWALDEMRAAWEAELAAPQAAPAAVAAALLARAQAIHDDDVDRCLRIGEHGAALFKAGDRILTHCNAGALATAGYGTALGVIRSAAAAARGHLRVGRRDPPAAAGRAPHRLGAAGGGHPVPAHQRQHGRVLHAPRRGRRRRGRRRPHRRQRRHGQQDRHVQRQRAREGARRAVLRGRAALDGGPDHRERGRHPHRGARPAEVTCVPRRAGRARGRQARHPAFDVTPAANIAAIITEAGVLRAPFGRALSGACETGECRP